MKHFIFALLAVALLVPCTAFCQTVSDEEKADGFVSCFDGKTMDGWNGDTTGYFAQDGVMVCKPGGNVYLAKDYKNFIYRFEFKLTENANNGVGIRCERGKDAAYYGMEIQVLDNSGSAYRHLQPYQYHGSIYGIVPADRDCQKPVGEWNTEEIYVNGPKIKVTVNGKVIVDADIANIQETADGKGRAKHPGLDRRTGHIGWLGHGDLVKFKNIRKRLKNLNLNCMENYSKIKER